MVVSDFKLYEINILKNISLSAANSSFDSFIYIHNFRVSMRRAVRVICVPHVCFSVLLYVSGKRCQQRMFGWMCLCTCGFTRNILCTLRHVIDFIFVLLKICSRCKCPSKLPQPLDLNLPRTIYNIQHILVKIDRISN